MQYLVQYLPKNSMYFLKGQTQKGCATNTPLLTGDLGHFCFSLKFSFTVLFQIISLIFILFSAFHCCINSYSINNSLFLLIPLNIIILFLNFLLDFNPFRLIFPAFSLHKKPRILSRFWV